MALTPAVIIIITLTSICSTVILEEKYLLYAGINLICREYTGTSLISYSQSEGVLLVIYILIVQSFLR